ncbi:MAG: DUF721 domain-containing protein [Spirochaetota bacterium]
MEKAGALLQVLFERLSIQDDRGFVRFFSSWRKIAGNDLADHSKLVDVRRNAAVVVVDHPGWMQLLRMQQERILKHMQREFPDLEIHTLHIYLVDERVGNALNAGIRTEPGAVEGMADMPVTPLRRPQVTADPERALERVDDSELKQRLAALKKAMESSDR